MVDAGMKSKILNARAEAQCCLWIYSLQDVAAASVGAVTYLIAVADDEPGHYKCAEDKFTAFLRATV